MEPWVSSVKRGAAAQPPSFLPLPVSSSADAGVGGVPLHQHRFRVLSVTVSPALSSLPSASLHLHGELHHSSVPANLRLPPSDLRALPRCHQNHHSKPSALLVLFPGGATATNYHSLKRSLRLLLPVVRQAPPPTPRPLPCTARYLSLIGAPNR